MDEIKDDISKMLEIFCSDIITDKINSRLIKCDHMINTNHPLNCTMMHRTDAAYIQVDWGSSVGKVPSLLLA